jgi:hypothetical protein
MIRDIDEDGDNKICFKEVCFSELFSIVQLFVLELTQYASLSYLKNFLFVLVPYDISKSNEW